MAGTDDRLLQHILAMTRALDSCRGRVTIDMGNLRRIPGKRDLVRRLLIQDLREATTLLVLVHKVTQSLQALARQLEEFNTASESRTIDPGSTEANLWDQHFQLISELKVLTKALYEWVYHIREDLESVPTLRAAVPKALWSRLERFCTFRKSLVTHKTTLKVHTGGGLRSSKDFAKFEILMVPFRGLPETAGKELKTLYEVAKSYLDPGEAAEENNFERMAILYRRLSLFPGHLQARVKPFIAQYGTISDTPRDLAEFLDELAAALVLRLAGK